MKKNMRFQVNFNFCGSQRDGSEVLQRFQSCPRLYPIVSWKFDFFLNNGMIGITQM